MAKHEHISFVLYSQHYFKGNSWRFKGDPMVSVLVIVIRELEVTRRRETFVDILECGSAHRALRRFVPRNSIVTVNAESDSR
jgi:hypothetical protein